MNQHQVGRIAAGIQGVPGIGKVPGQPINTSNIGKITPISRDGNIGGPVPSSTSGTTPPALQNRQKSDNYHQIINSRENYVRQDLNNHYQTTQGPMQVADGSQRANMLANLSKHNRGSSVTPNIPNLATDLGGYSGRNEALVTGQLGSAATGDLPGSNGAGHQYRTSLPNQGITKSR